MTQDAGKLTPTRTARRKPGDLDAVFITLRRLMLDEAPRMTLLSDNPGALELNAPIANPLKPAESLWFGAVRKGASYVSFHLMPLYLIEDLAKHIPESLRKRMQGKTCFNFRRIDEAAFAELRALTRLCAERTLK